jgi:dihydroorotase
MARYMGRVIVMPNLVPPVTTVRLAAEYRQRILRAMQGAAAAVRAADDPVPHRRHLRRGYPRGRGTLACGGQALPGRRHDQFRRRRATLEALYPVLEVMEEVDLPLLVHGEVTEAEVDIFDREAVYRAAPGSPSWPLSRGCASCSNTSPPPTRWTLSAAAAPGRRDDHRAPPAPQPQRHAGRRHPPHYYCLPILKRRQHQEALRAAAGGDRSFFLGTDSAPHDRLTKESACGCAGVYTAHASLEFYAEVFEEMDALERLEAFASPRGPDFYRRPRNSDTVTLRRVEWRCRTAAPGREHDWFPCARRGPALAGCRWRRRLTQCTASRQRFRGFLPVIVDMETGGFSRPPTPYSRSRRRSCAWTTAGMLAVHSTHSFNVAPFEGANIEQSALDFTGIDPWHPFREAQDRKRGARRAVRNRAPRNPRPGLQPRDSGRPQRPLRRGLSERRGGALRDQAQSLPPLLTFRYRHAGRPGLRPDRAGQELRRGGHRLRQRAGPLGGLRRGAHRGTVLPSSIAGRQLGGWVPPASDSD